MKKSGFEIISNKKYQWIVTILILIFVLILSVNIRVSNLPLLKDSTTDEWIPVDLDSYYFLRIGETLIENDGVLPKFDDMRYSPRGDSVWHPEIMPRVVVFMYGVVSVFDPNIDFRYIYILSPIVFYGIGLILFFFLIYILTKSKIISLLSSVFLAFNPAYLFRTMSPDHDSIGMVAFFLTIIVYSLALIYLKEEKRRKIWGGLIAGAILAFSTNLTYACWGGVTFFLFIIIPLSFFLIWLFQTKESKTGDWFVLKGVVFYLGWISFSLLIGPLFGRKMKDILGIFMSSSNIASIAILVFVIIDLFFISVNLNFVKKNFRILYSLITTIILGFIGLFAIGKNPFNLITTIFKYLIKPFGTGRFGTTVAENAQPFLQDWINNVGSHIFWLFLLGSIMFGIYLTRKIKNFKQSFLFGILYILMTIGIVFSKYSPSSIFNGDNFVSQIFYIITLLAFWAYFFYVYLKNDFTWEVRDNIIFALIFYTIIAGRAAARVFFPITPFICFIAAYFVVGLYFEWKKSKDEILKIVFVLFLIIGVVVSGIVISISYQTSMYAAERTGPSADNQWQLAMDWVRNNTPIDAVFCHWWDYGYWVQTLGERATVADGGQFQGAEDGNHKIGRYVLTTTNPITAYSYFKSMNVTHFLIDQTDLGKYPAYSKIGGGDGPEQLDRFSAIPIMLIDEKQTRETSNGTVFVYNGGSYLYEDIIYNNNGQNIFLPAEKAAVIGIILNVEDSHLKQPEVVYFYNNIQTKIPARYIYIDGEIVDFKSGLDVIIDVIPALSTNNINQMGAAIYLSQKVSKSLFARLYLMDDAFNEYGTISLGHSEDSPVIASLKAQGIQIGDFVYYQGFRGPIKIWNIKYPDGIPVHSEFYKRIDFNEVGFGSLDKLFF